MILGCVQGAFAGNAIGAAVKFMSLSEITDDVVEQGMNLRKQAAGMEKGEIDEDFEINHELIKALEESKD